MKQFVFGVIQALSKFIPTRLFSILLQRDLINFFYHIVTDTNVPHIRHLYPVVPISLFLKSLDFLQERYSFISYSELHDHYQRGSPLPEKPVHLSFDDGFAECFSIVRPILIDRSIPCTFFLTTDWLDNRKLYFRHIISLCVDKAKRLKSCHQIDFIERLNNRTGLSHVDINDFSKWLMEFRQNDKGLLDEICHLLSIDLKNYLAESKPYLTRDQVRQMDLEGFTIGAHGMSHQKLGFVHEDVVEQEIVGSCKVIQEITGQAIVPFSFPQSAARVDRSMLYEILDHNPLVGLLFDTKDLRIDNKFLLNRVWAERPLTSERKLHPISEILRHAYQDAWVDGVVKVLKE